MRGSVDLPGLLEKFISLWPCLELVRPLFEARLLLGQSFFECMGMRDGA
jgi:hypothetical protein